MIKAVVFDADGVLFETERFSHVLDRDYKISKQTTKEFFENVFPKCRTGEADLKEVILPYLPKWGWNKDAEAFFDIWFNIEYKLNHELLDYIKNLRTQGVLCFIATNQEKHRFQYFFDKLHLQNTFDKAYVSAHLGTAKPDIEFFEKIYNELKNINKNEVLFIDDKVENVKSAETFGFHALFWKSFQGFKTKLEQLNRE